MLARLRGARVGPKTALLVVLLALAAWAVIVYGSVRDAVPDDLRAPTSASSP